MARQVPGAVPAAFSVDNNGAATYTIELDVPPGIQGLEPHLALAYKSQAGNGILGVGWQLSGLSGISRCRASYPIDGYIAPIEYDDDDRFCLDGQRLINVAGAYGDDGTIYRTELETWRKLVSNGTCGSGPCSFTVTLKNGATWTYGGASGRIRAVGRDDVRVWALDEASDLNGNFLRVSYTEKPISQSDSDDGQYYPQRIDYTGNGAFETRFSVRFSYEERSDVRMAWLGGSPVNTLARLKTVATYLDNTPIKTWILDYWIGVASGRSRLGTITECGGHGEEEICLPQTVVSVTGNEEPEFHPGDSTATGAGTEALGYFPMDINGDGRGDLLQAWNRGGELQLTSYLSDGRQFKMGVDTATGTGTEALGYFPMDVDGDGRTDLVQAFSTDGKLRLLPWYAEDNGTFTAGEETKTDRGIEHLAFYPMDVNADGRSDLVQTFSSSGKLSLVAYLATGTRLGPGFDGGTLTETGAGAQALTFLPMDANGDARIDLVQLWEENGRLRSTAYLSASRIRDQGRFSSGLDTTFESGIAHLAFLPLDVNGDGITDVVQLWTGAGNTLSLTVYSGRGDGTFTQGTDSDLGESADALGFWPMDMVGDAATDLVQGFPGADGKLDFLVYRPSGDRFVETVTTQTGESVAHIAFWPMDVNGDGKADLVRAWSGEDGTLMLEPLFSAGPSPDLAESFTDGFGGRVRVDYLAISDPAVYSEDIDDPSYPHAEGVQYVQRLTPAVYPIENVEGGPTHVVARYVKENVPEINPSDYSYPYLYHYGGARMALGGRGWLGFRDIERTNGSTGQTRLSRFYQDFPMTGVPATVEMFCGASADPYCQEEPKTLLAGSETFYEQRVTASAPENPQAPPGTPTAKVYEVLKKTAYTDILSYGEAGVRLKEEFQYNEFGDLTQQVSFGEVDAVGKDIDPQDNLHTCYGYATDDPTGPWRYGYVSDLKMSSTGDLCDDFSSDAFRRGIDFSLAHRTYDVAGGTMNVISESAWDDINRVELETTYSDYDRFGNVGMTTDPAGDATAMTWESGFHTYPDTIKAPASAPILVQTFGYNPRFGILVAAVDANGHVSTTCLDPLGRTTARQGPRPEIPDPPTDPSCVPGDVTGSTVFSTKPVLTLIEADLQHDELGVYYEGRALQDWPGAETPPEQRVLRHFRAFQDGLGRSYKTTAEAETEAGDLVRCAVFNAGGKIIFKSLPFFGQPTADCTADSPDVPWWTETHYDAYGRPVVVRYPAGDDGSLPGETKLSYPDALTTVVVQAPESTIPLRKRLEYRYVNEQRKIHQMVLPDQGDATTTFVFDAVGRPLHVTDPKTPDNPNGVTNSFTWDSLDRPLTSNNPDQNTTGKTGVVAERYTYGTDGRLEVMADAAGQTSTYVYDQLGRVLEVLFSDGSSIHNTWDKGPNGLGRMSRTALERGDTVSSSYDFSYDPYGNRTLSVLALDGEHDSYETAAEYDPMSRIRLFRYADGSRLDREFIDGRLQSVKLDDALVASYFDYSPLGKPREVIYGNGLVTGYEYSPTGQVTRQTVEGPAGGGVEIILDQSLQWNELFELRRLEDHLSADGSWGYEYKQGRLEIAEQRGTRPRIFAYGYDASGNLVDKDGISYVYAAHRIESGWIGEQQVLAIGYDPNGNTASRQVLVPEKAEWTYDYDVRQKLVRVTKDDQDLLELGYGPLGRRLAKIRYSESGDKELVQIVPGPGMEIRRFADGTTQALKYVRGLSGTVAIVTTEESDASSSFDPQGAVVAGQETLFVTRDHLGSTSIVTDESAMPRFSMAFLPWGEEDMQITTRPPDFSRPTYEGRELDEASGLYDFGARYYNPQQGRFLTPDTQLGSGPLDPDAWNRFAFALNSPVVYVDPTGHSIFKSIVGTVVGAAEVAAGVAIDVASAGTLESVGGALVDAGVGGITYSVTNSGNFSWKQYGVQEAAGAALGLVTGGLGALADIGADAFEEVGADLTEDVATDVFGDVAEDADSAAEEDVLAGSDGTSDTAANEDLHEQGEESRGEGDFCTASFAAGTLITTEEGQIPIEDIAVDDHVLGYDEVSDTYKPYRVTGLYDRTSPMTIVIDLGSEKIYSTEQHPFRVRGRGWIEAVDLEQGDELETLREEAVKVVAIRTVAGSRRFFNFTVANVHNYAISPYGISVHNANVQVGGPAVGCGGGGGEPPDENKRSLFRHGDQTSADVAFDQEFNAIKNKIRDRRKYTPSDAQNDLQDLFHRHGIKSHTTYTSKLRELDTEFNLRKKSRFPKFPKPFG